MRRCSKIDISSPLAAMALLLLLLLVSSSFHRAAAARLLQPSVPLTAHHENGAKAAAAAAAAASASASDGLVLQSGAVVNADELVSSEMSEAEAEEACEEGNDEDCMQRRLLHDAHLDYIYTQRKGKP